MRARRPTTRLAPLPPRPLAMLAALAGGFCAAPASAENFPLSLGVSQQVQHDSNLLRRDTNIESDTISSTGLQIGLDKSYGRQRYTADLVGRINRYSNFDVYNNNSYDLNGGFQTEIGRDIALGLNGNTTEELARFEDAGRSGLTTKNTRNVRQANARLTYGLHGPLSLNFNWSGFKQDYDVNNGYFEDVKSRTLGAGLSWSPRQLLSFGVGVSQTDSDVDSGSVAYDKTRRSVDLSTRWQVTGVSSLFGRVSLGKEERDLPGANSWKNDNWSALVTWNYRPRGRLVFDATLSRTTGSTGSLTETDYGLFGFFTTSQNEATTSTALNLKVGWEATAKIRLEASADYTLYDRSRRVAQASGLFGNSSASASTSSHFTAFGLSASYTPYRWLQLSCGAQRLKRTADLTFGYNSFDADIVYCSGTFYINGMY